jgi:hypothetical protein
LTGTVAVALLREQAFVMFTPSGERTWADGWDPSFLAPGEDETAPGTVFRTLHSGRETIWTVTCCKPGRSIKYALTTPGERCGLVTVACESSGKGTEATVSYDLTSLSTGANDSLERFARNYPAFLSHWERSIAEAVKGGSS